MLLIPISLALLALTAGMFLLAKTKKEELGRFFKGISYFIIVGSFFVMALTIVGGFTRMLLHRMHHKRQHEHRMYMGERMPMIGNRFFEREEMMGGMRHPEGRNEMSENEDMDMATMDHEQHERNPEERNERTIKRLTEKLNLTKDQVAKVQEIFKNSAKTEDGDRDQRRKAHQERMEAVKKILTPDQLKLLDERNEDNMPHN